MGVIKKSLRNFVAELSGKSLANLISSTSVIVYVVVVSDNELNVNI